MMNVDPSGYEFTIGALMTSIVVVVFTIAIIYQISIMTSDDALTLNVPTLDDYHDFMLKVIFTVVNNITKLSSYGVSLVNELSERSNNGTYAIGFSDGKHYIGKGSPFRMIASATRIMLAHGISPVSFRYEYAKNEREAFKKEYVWMVEYEYYSKGSNKKNMTYNKIWSPGRNYYLIDNKGNYYPGDYYGR